MLSCLLVKVVQSHVAWALSYLLYIPLMDDETALECDPLSLSVLRSKRRQQETCSGDEDSSESVKKRRKKGPQ